MTSKSASIPRRRLLRLLPLLLAPLLLTRWTSAAEEVGPSSPLPSSSSSSGHRRVGNVDADDGHSNLREGLRLFESGRYHEATGYLWRAVLLQTRQGGSSSSSSRRYSADDAFVPFLRCYRALDRIVDGLVFVSAEGYLRGQDDMGDAYLREAMRLTSDDGREHDGASRLRRLVESHEWRREMATRTASASASASASAVASSSWRYLPLREIRDDVDASNARRRRGDVGGGNAAKEEDDDDGDFWAQFDEQGGMGSSSSPLAASLAAAAATTTTTATMATTATIGEGGDGHANGMSPEELFDVATRLFNDEKRIEAGRLYELSCKLSNRRLYPACANAVYIRTTYCDWGHRGTGYEKDMRAIVEITVLETLAYRSVVRYLDGGDLVVIGGDEETTRKAYSSVIGVGGGGADEIRRLNGIGRDKKKSNDRGDDDDDDEGGLEFTHWTRPASVHPHMMLGYLPKENTCYGLVNCVLENDGNAMLKRYVAESYAHVDEIRARMVGDGKGVTIRPLPPDLPYGVDEDLRAKMVRRHRGGKTAPPIKVGFVACSFNSKAVLYLSHDMFRFFDPDAVEVHVFSTGNPDSRLFIQGVMRGVDWRQRVIDTVDYFHDVRRYSQDHFGLARYIREEWEMEILIDWDGYARQGERAMGLMALRPAPIQILHQEFLMTSGAQYFDYIVTDMVTSPPRLEGLYTEKFIYLPNHFFSKGHAVQGEVRPPTLEYVPRKKGLTSFQIGVGSPQENACQSPNPLGGANNNEVSFVYCNFNKFLKNNPETMRSWIRILRDVPNSILCLLEYPKEGVANLRKFVTEEATPFVDDETGGSYMNDDASDVNDRIHFIQWEWNPFDHQQRTYSLCNVMLDSHPYNGHTTAQDAYFAGVPIVTRSDGLDMSSRVTTSASVVLGLEELNAYNGARDYETIAVRLGTEEAWFKSIRAKLVESCLQKNPMHEYWDVPRYVRNFERGLKMAWDDYLDGKEIDHVIVSEDGEKELRGTMEDELLSREERRRNMERYLMNDEL